MSQQLEKFQALSIFTKGITLAVGIIQSLAIIRILSVAEYGIVGLIISIGSFIGVYQHLGLQEGIVREVSATKRRDEAAKVIFVSFLARLFITIPIVILLFVFARFISVNLYHQKEIIGILRFFSLILLLQGIEGVIGAALAGLQKFKALFGAQIISSIIALILLVSFTYFWSVNGFFYAMALASVFMIIIMLVPLAKELGNNIIRPARREFKEILYHILGISFIVYLARILFTFWQRMGILILGLFPFITNIELGFFNMALAFGTKLVILSNAVSEVNLAVMTRKFAENYEDFIATFKSNFIKVFSLVLFISLSVIFFAKEIIVYIIGTKYIPALKIVPIIIISFFLYSVIDLIANSLFVPSKKQIFRFYTFLITVIISGASIFLFIKGDNLIGTSLGLLAGILAGTIFLIENARRQFKIQIISKKEILIILTFLPIIIAGFLNISFAPKVIIYVLNAGLFAFAVQKLEIVNLKNWKRILHP